MISIELLTTCYRGGNCTRRAQRLKPQGSITPEDYATIFAISKSYDAINV